MKVRHHRKILRFSTFLAVTVGLSIGSSAMAQQEEAPQFEPSQHYAQQQEQEDDTFFDDLGADDDAEERQEADQQRTAQEEQARGEDLSGAVEDFHEFVEEHRAEGIENIFEYTYEGANHMADAMEEVIPEDRDDLESAVNNWEDRLDSLESEDRGELYPALASVLLTEGADLLEQIQQAGYPALGDSVQEVRQHAEQIDPNQPIQEQAQQVENYFTSASGALATMYRTGVDEPVQEEEEPVSGLEVMYAAAPGAMLAQIDPMDEPQQDPMDEPGEDPMDQPQQEEDDGFFDWGEDPGPDVPAAVEDFDEFVLEHRQEGIPHVANYTREGSQHFHDALESLLPDEGTELIEEQLDRFQESVNALDVTPRPQYPNTLRQTLNEGTQVLTMIQQAYYPQQEEQVQELYPAVEEIDVNRSIEAQVNVIQNFYIQAANVTRTMGEETPEERPFAERADGIAQAGGEHDYEPGEMDEPREWEGEELMEDDIGGGPIMHGALTDYQNFVQGLDEEAFAEQGEEQVVQGLRLLDHAIMASVEAAAPVYEEPIMQPGEEQEEPVIDPVQAGEWDQPGMEEPGAEPGMEEPGLLDDQLAEGRAEINDKRLEFTENINELEEMIGEEEFVEKFEETMESAMEVYSTMQEQEGFNVPEAQVDMVRTLVESFDAETSLEEQSSLIVNFFRTSGDLLQGVHQDPELQVLR